MQKNKLHIIKKIHLVNIGSLSVNHLAHCFRNSFFNGLLMDTSNGCRQLVNPAGMVKSFILLSINVVLTNSVVWARNSFIISKEFFPLASGLIMEAI